MGKWDGVAGTGTTLGPHHPSPHPRPLHVGPILTLTHVYEEYAKGYDHLKKWQLALDYIDKAEKTRKPTKTSEILLKVARAEVLIHSGDLRNGEPLAVEAALYSRKYGHYRRLERIYALKRYINQ